ncbi:NO-associated protein 1 chloroplastic/mitochondrial [Zea mays]|uniref:NO-associated protein 1 chloroplastic/mitochondrial n=1 Tax=Zea mays TaxID=4577 RepID=A0A1D6KYV4_MAIZE|nr:NO-associated protein 1 chloroplastic/mitochondrial [Zea mays]ONM07565.1 NO-associated protein 1 chloroplastic/mitochondrial [Zea mays]
MSCSGSTQDPSRRAPPLLPKRWSVFCQACMHLVSCGCGQAGRQCVLQAIHLFISMQTETSLCLHRNSSKILANRQLAQRSQVRKLQYISEPKRNCHNTAASVAISDLNHTLLQGSANVGKYAFISAMLRTMAYKDPVAAAAQKYKPIQSAVPRTTLGPIQIEAFLGGGNLCLIEFYTSSWKRKPHQVIISRNDVSESQFNLVLNIELQQIIDGD